MKHVGVIFNTCLLDSYTTQILTSTTVSIECISRLIKVLIIMMHGGNLKLKILKYFSVACNEIEKSPQLEVICRLLIN